MVVNCQVGAGSQIQVLCKNRSAPKHRVSSLPQEWILYAIIRKHVCLIGIHICFHVSWMAKLYTCQIIVFKCISLWFIISTYLICTPFFYNILRLYKRFLGERTLNGVGLRNWFLSIWLKIRAVCIASEVSRSESPTIRYIKVTGG